MFKNKTRLLQNLADGLKAAENRKIGVLRVWFVTPEYRIVVYGVGQALDHIINDVTTLYYDAEHNHGVLDTQGATIGQYGTNYRIDNAIRLEMESY